MKRILLAALITAFAAGSAFAQSCETKAMGKDGKPLAGAAKSSFVKKCKHDACEGKAVGSNGKPLVHADSFSFTTNPVATFVEPLAAEGLKLHRALGVSIDVF